MRKSEMRKSEIRKSEMKKSEIRRSEMRKLEIRNLDMKKYVCVPVMACLLAAAGCGAAQKHSPQRPAADTMSRTLDHAKELTQDIGIGINLDYSKPSMQPVCKFGYRLLKQNLDEANPALSPVSAYITLCMLGKGAQGATEQEIRDVLGSDMMCIPDDLMNTLPYNKEEDNTVLSIANSAWIDEIFTAGDQWLGTVNSLFDAQVYQTDLQADTAVGDINHWVSENTNQKITQLLDQPLDENAVLVLLNALYFQADWEQQFKAENTFDWNFTTDDGKTEKVPMMNQLLEDCLYLKDDTAEGVILPYADSNLAFVAVKPLGKENIRDWYGSYSAKKLQALVGSGKNTLVDLGLPKFTVRFHKNLNNSLKNMGIKLAYEAKQADLSLLGTSGFENEGNLYLGTVLQEAEIEVGEEGTKAAAATAAEVLSGGGMPQERKDVIFDRSFLYMIMDIESGAPVFMGILDQPE